MTEQIWCITALAFLAWVIYLHFQISALKQENEKMKKALHQKIKNLSKDVEMGSGEAVWGHNPSLTK